MSVKHFFYQTVRITLLMSLVFVLLVAIAAAYIWGYMIPRLPSTEHLKEVRLQVPLRVYTKDGSLIAEFGEQHRIPVNPKKLPPLLKKAVLAAEDDRFYEHSGVDMKGVLRAVFNLVKTGGEKQQGASTITMQVARNFFLTPEKTFSRKFNEMLLAFKIEEELNDKDEILGLYLNKIFFGHRSYGIAAAAQVYYGKDIQELSLAEWAMLAAIPKAPSENNPVSNPQRSLERRNYVLRRMRELGYIKEEEYQAAVKTENTAKLYSSSADIEASYMGEMVRTYMLEKHDKEAVYNNGYKVYTTIDTHLQTVAQTALRKALFEYDERHGYRKPRDHKDLPAKLTDVDKIAQDILQDRPTQGNLQPSLVLEVKPKSIVAYNLEAKQFEIAWEDLAWARPYVNDDRRGAAPRTASDIAKRGDIIMVRSVMRKPTVKKKPAKPSKNKADPDTEEEQTAEEDADSTVAPVQHWRLAEVPQVEGALVALRPDDGAILALAGGFDFYQSKFNRVTQAERQPGSNFKPFLYSAAFDNGFTPATVVNDAPIVIDTGTEIWRPENFGGRFYGPTSLRKALVYSRNLVSIRLLQDLGVTRAIKHIVKFGFKQDKLPPNFTMALGTGEVTPLELVTGFAVFANGGYKVEPYFIERIEDAMGTVIFSANPLKVCRDCTEKTAPKAIPTSNQPNTDNATNSATEVRLAPLVIRPQNAWVMTSILKDVIRIGTGTRALKLNRSDIAGKTGTTNGPNDAWFSGYTPDIVATAWVGFDQPRSLGDEETGGRSALPMWIDFMEEALKDKPIRTLPIPKGIINIKVDPSTGLLASGDNPRAVFEPFLSDAPPKRYIPSQNSNSSSNSSKASANPLVPDSLF